MKSTPPLSPEVLAAALLQFERQKLEVEVAKDPKNLVQPDEEGLGRFVRDVAAPIDRMVNSQYARRPARKYPPTTSKGVVTRTNFGERKLGADLFEMLAPSEEATAIVIEDALDLVERDKGIEAAEIGRQEVDRRRAIVEKERDEFISKTERELAELQSKAAIADEKIEAAIASRDAFVESKGWTPERVVEARAILANADAGERLRREAAAEAAKWAGLGQRTAAAVHAAMREERLGFDEAVALVRERDRASGRGATFVPGPDGQLREL